MTRPLLLGHRGARASRHIPENTVASFELCLQHGCDGFEFDVRQSADGQAVVCHDPVFHGMNIATTTSAVLGLCTLDEVLTTFGGRAFLDIELKVAGLEERTRGLLREHPPQKGFVVSSFLPQVLDTLHDLDATIPLGFICDNAAEILQGETLPVEWVMPEMSLADATLIARLHGAGKKIMVWTVNNETLLRGFANVAVDGIISDKTELATRIRFAG
jgi:glycerophosphoryl diester phosphodiesterase